MIAIIDYDIGNLGAIANMFGRLGVESAITRDPDLVAKAERIILPGNGAFDACMNGLNGTGLVPLLDERVRGAGVPLLGICVGAQMLGRGSEEGQMPGLGWLDFDVRRFPALEGLKIPHMGWNEVRIEQQQHPLTRGMTADSRYYFVHSYYIETDRPDDRLLTAHYGVDFAAAVASKNISGVQFHPEKSHRFGKALLGNFAKGTA